MAAFDVDAGAPAPKAPTPGGRQDRFPGFDLLGEVRTWDAVTAGVVLARLAQPPALRFFSVVEEGIAGALFDQLLAQFEGPKVPLLQMVDSRLAENVTDGWRYEDMPEDTDAWHLTLARLDSDAHDLYGRGFAELDRFEQADLIQNVQDLAGKEWHGLPATHVWSLWTRYACAAFYSHPWAWNEIGFGGPAYPRGYKHLGIDAREGWEVPDVAPRDPAASADQLERPVKEHAAAVRRQRERRS
jgi:hypothetical protein